MMQTSKAGRLNNSNGFTLVELGMVLFLLALFAVFTIPLLYSNTNDDLRSEAHKIATSVRYLYNEAAISRTEHRLRCELETGVFTLEFVDGAGEWRGIEGKRNTITLKDSVHVQDIWIEDRGKISKGSATINIYPQGWMPATTIHLQTGTGAKTIELSIHLLPLSGIAEIEEGYHDFED
ncbi:MAG: type II secretion system protein [Desulfuromonadaceae bacterium]|nr:type II secretion system protein [Desulfuromonadaceae bacterium]